ncbi:unnamed protein product [Dicrocoelium dendriticum]|nr:unnamed protein product [Dicrocoelium dendriticum]
MSTEGSAGQLSVKMPDRSDNWRQSNLPHRKRQLPCLTAEEVEDFFLQVDAYNISSHKVTKPSGSASVQKRVYLKLPSEAAFETVRGSQRTTSTAETEGEGRTPKIQRRVRRWKTTARELIKAALMESR